jgi:hypothetical protein
VAAPIWVIGCPRSGTRYTSEVFRQAGYDVRHERMGAAGTSNHAALPLRIPDSAVVVHQVRHPLDCITSMQTLNAHTCEVLMRSTAVSGIEFRAERRIEVCSRLWLFYNAQCEALAAATFRVECDEEWERACIVASLSRIDRCSVSESTNSRKALKQYRDFYLNPVTVERIEHDAGVHVAQAIVRQARRYGYEL